MKKLLVFLLLLACFGYLANCDQFVEASIFGKISAKRACFLMQNAPNDQLFEEVEVVLSGNQVFCFCEFSFAEEFYKVHKDEIDGVQLYFDGVKPNEFFEKLDCQNISSKSVSGGCLYEAYTPYFLKSVNDGGKKVNIQLFCKDGEMVVGLPLIFTGF